jgi:superfamily II DNA or RNA helicase
LTAVLTAESLVLVRDPLRWPLALGSRTDTATVTARVRVALAGPRAQWHPPHWLLDHQIDAAKRIAGALEAFHGALLCDAVGLGKTYVALGVARRYRRPVAVVPAVLKDQWRHTAQHLAIPADIISHESLSRGQTLPDGDLYIVDEAHRFRNAATARYDRLAQGIRRAHVLLATATPVVNAPVDLSNLLRLFSPDHALAPLGVDSLESVRSGARHRVFARCILPLIVSRTASVAGLPHDAMPHVFDAPVIAARTLDPTREHRVIDAVTALRFPTFETRSAAELLRLHLFHRLSSSVEACRVTLRRHAAYLERAIDTARRGERLTRRDAHRLFEPDDDQQLDFPFSLEAPSTPVDARALEEELCRIRSLGEMLADTTEHNDKLRALRQILDHHPQGRSIVFVGSVHTGLDLARGLGWRNVVTVSGRGARIASGPLPIRDALTLFAPFARGASAPPERTQARVLIATDLVSEGLDLQDAHQVIHYDLPWTPLRLQQRLGRVARLGSRHRQVSVQWFAPSAELDLHLRFRDRIATKEHWQRNLAVAVSSRIGESTVVGHCLGQRERLTREVTNGNGRHVPAAGPVHAVVSGPHAAAVALDWRCGNRTVPVVVVLAGGHWHPVQPIDRWLAYLEQLLSGAASTAPVPPGLDRALETFVRARLGASLAGPRDTETVALARQLVRLAREAARARSAHRLPDLEGALDQLVTGLPAGGLRALRDIIRSRAPWRALHRWNRDQRHTDPSDSPSVLLRAALIGDGSCPS